MKIKRKHSTNEIFEICAQNQVKITVRKLDKGTVLIEGANVGLEFLGNLLLALAGSNEHSVQFSPNGAGSACFTRESTLGLYLHKLPCEEGSPHKASG
jgi:hypothetical protein